MLTNKEMAILSAQIDWLALQAGQSLSYPSVTAYYNAAEQYYLKLAALIDDRRTIEALREKWRSLRDLIESNPKCRTRRAVRLMLDITKDFYFEVRMELQKRGYYFRTSRVKEKGLNKVKYDDHEEVDDKDE